MLELATYDKYIRTTTMVNVRDTERVMPTTYLEAEQNLLKELEDYISNLRIAIKESKVAK